MAGPFASVTDTMPEAIAPTFDETERRDPDRRYCRVVLVDGNRHQAKAVGTETADRGLAVHNMLNVIHVLEYI